MSWQAVDHNRAELSLNERVDVVNQILCDIIVIGNPFKRDFLFDVCDFAYISCFCDAHVRIVYELIDEKHPDYEYCVETYKKLVR